MVQRAQNVKISWSKYFKEWQSTLIIITACVSPSKEKTMLEWEELKASLKTGISATSPVNRANKVSSSLKRCQHQQNIQQKKTHQTK